MKILIGFILVSLSLAQSFAKELPDCSADAGFKDRQELNEFTEKLKTADSADALSPLISYPLRVNINSQKHLVIKNGSELKNRFNEVFPERILKVIKRQDPKITFCNYQGLTIGGAVWINRKNGKTGIYSVNLSAK